jgi:hypothetical protein
VNGVKLRLVLYKWWLRLPVSSSMRTSLEQNGDISTIPLISPSISSSSLRISAFHTRSDEDIILWVLPAILSPCTTTIISEVCTSSKTLVWVCQWKTTLKWSWIFTRQTILMEHVPPSQAPNSLEHQSRPVRISRKTRSSEP